MSVVVCYRKGIQLAHLGKCTTLAHADTCPGDCKEEDGEPVCGSDGNVYRWGSYLAGSLYLECGSQIVHIKDIMRFTVSG